MRRRRAGLATGLLVAALLAGACGSTPATTGSDSSSGSGGGAGSTSGGSKEFTMWSMWAQGEVAQKFEQAQIDEFTKETGIKVDVQWKGRGVSTALLPTLNTGAPPTDLVEDSAATIATLLGPTGGVKELTDFYAQKVPGLSETFADVVGVNKSAAQPMSDAGVLGAPLSVPYWLSAFGIYYNGANFPDLATSPPKTWSDFVKILDAQKAKGRQPLALDGSIASYNWRYFESLSRSVLGDKSITDAIIDKTGKAWGNRGFLQAANLVEALVKGNYFSKGYNGSKFPAMENAWANNDSDFIMMGTWLPAEVAPVVAPGFQFRVFPFPAVTGHDTPTTTVTAAGYAVMKSSKNADAAEKFIAFMLSKDSQAKVGTAMQEIPILKGIAAPASMQGLKSLLDNGGIAQGRVPDAASDFYTKVLYPMDDNLVLGKVTAAQFISQLQAAAVTYWKAKS